MDKSKPKAEAVAIQGGKIAAVGSNDEILKLKADGTKIIDLEGKLVLPGFNDSHMHLYSFGESLRMVDLLKVDSIGAMITKVQEFINVNYIEQGKWVRGRGWNQDYFNVEKRFPNRYDLDKISTVHPIVLSRVCGHVAVVNSRMLEVLGITSETQQVEGGHFDIDAAGEPLGIFRENALKLIFDQMPESFKEEIKDVIREAVKYANSKGLTSVQTDDLAHVSGEDFTTVIEAYKELSQSGELTVRVYEQCLISDIDKLKAFIDRGYTTGVGDEFIKIGPLKILADGSLGARTAALVEPYSDDPSNKGIAAYSQSEMDELVSLAHDNGMHVAIHSIGDRIMYSAFESIEKALKKNPRANHRHGIVHCQITDETLLNRFRDLEVVAHIQPIFLNYDIHMVEDRIGVERAKHTYAFKTMIDRGVHVALGTDCPVEPLDTMPNLYSAVTRQDLKGYPTGGWLPEEKLTVEEAVYCYTMGSAYASFEEDIKGSISYDKFADLVVLSDNIFEIEKENIKDTDIVMTIFNGQIVYRGTR